jgi:hypothetical protein
MSNAPTANVVASRVRERAPESSEATTETGAAELGESPFAILGEAAALVAGFLTPFTGVALRVN